MPPQEIEFKFAVDDLSAFKRLIAHLDLPARLVDGGLTQVNHFFDTADFALRSLGASVRMREQSGIFILTIKALTGNETSQTALTERYEYETQIPTESAHGLLRNRSLPLDSLKEAFVLHADAVDDLLRRGGIDHALSYIGHFTNTRIQLPLTLHTNNQRHELIMELDASDFPGQPTAYEVEVEIATRENAPQIQTALTQLLKNAGVQWHTTSNKVVRFFAALHREDSHR